MKKYAVLTMDVEDWYHLDYFLNSNNLDKTYSMLNGVDDYLYIMDRYGIKSTFFILGEIAERISSKIKEIASLGHEVACHGLIHKRPVLIGVDEFRRQIICAKDILSNICGEDVSGYRAPSYGLDNDRFNVIKTLGFKYDSSRIKFTQHPLYGSFDISDFIEVKQGIYRKYDFFEFEVSTKALFNFQLPISGGGYFRLFPWTVTKHLIASYSKVADLYVFYIHPFELSNLNLPYIDGISQKTSFRANIGRNQVKKRLEKLIEFLKSQGYEFYIFKELREILLS